MALKNVQLATAASQKGVRYFLWQYGYTFKVW